MRKSRVRELRSNMGAAQTRLNKAEWILCEKFPELVMFLQAQKQFDCIARTYQAAWEELTQAQRNDLIPEFYDSSKVYKPKGETMSRRDMSHKEFTAALKRRGFRESMFGVEISDTHTMGSILRYSHRAKEYVLDRRATLKRAIEGARTDAKQSS